MRKLEYLRYNAAQIAEGNAAAVASEMLERIADEWGYPRPQEIGHYQLKFAASDRDGTTYHLRDKESGIMVEGRGRDGDQARRNGLWRLRQVLASDEERERCFPKPGSLHLAICSCKNSSGWGVGSWTSEDDFERVIDPTGYEQAANDE